MKKESIEHYCCPTCRSSQFNLNSPVYSKSDSSEIISGQLKCGNCGVLYVIKEGVPRFVPEENYADSFGFQWNIHHNTQLDSHTGLPITRDRLFSVTEWQQKLTGQSILEAGSGSGRFTEILLQTGATVYSFDLSLAVEANYRNHRENSNLCLFQGDIYHIPLQEQSFDKVMCLGVIQHTPDPEGAFKSLAKYVRPAGELVIDVYEEKLISYLHWRYLLRPITKRMDKKTLYKIVTAVVPVLLPMATFMRRIGGNIGARLLPIPDYSNLGLPFELNKQWSILDTFDIYSPAHDHPQTVRSVRRWFEEGGFIDIIVGHGPNGVIARGRKPPVVTD